MKYTICILFLIIPIYLLFTLPKEDTSDETIPLKEESTSTEKVVKLLNEEKVEMIDLEEYVVGVLACEMPASFHIEALKAQSVASRTYALEKMGSNSEYDLENSTNNQCFIDKDNMKKKWKASYELYYEKIKEAVNLTKGEYLEYEGKIIKALYFSTSNGYTEDVVQVFGGTQEYLVSVSSPWDIDSSTYKKEITMSIDEFIKKLKISEKVIKNIEINERSQSGRVKYITINDTKFKGTTFRTLLGIRSTDFDINIENNNILITTRGYGHGVGLSQYGANGMANEGYNYKEILAHYYKNTQINSIN